MDLNAVRMLVKVAETRSFTAAAAALALTQSGLSRAIGRLETELGVRLLHRTTRSVSLTPDGQLFYERCAPLLVEFDAAEQLLVDRRCAPSGPLKITTPLALGRIVLLPVIAGLTARYPDLQVEVSMTDRVVDLTEEGYDAAIRLGAVQDARIIARPLTALRWVTVAAPAYLKRRGTPAHPDALEAHNCIVVRNARTGKPVDWQFRIDGRLRRFAVRGNLTFDIGDALAQAALLGHGIAHVPAFMVDDALRRGQLVPLFEDCVRRPMPVSLVYPPSRQCSLKIGALVGALAGVDGAPPAWAEGL
ncbi:LysR family transcriptional regulator [Burkholderia sp. FERM BP-3421]|jgi:DNA-binding transcriptional LysR family regulator|uniref:LysR family transcriptional regulator n=1 Tax=Burkholderia sp. FERM BP-3421 TaxID=1494466 RepID=UPI00235E4240|nr:LysR family transcriptional regulator [Burkholderia sp. FERM BP-3421]WDD96502.1 LysR family transcriptional regulator [Burkholderia sp. FERM BP-3421]